MTSVRHGSPAWVTAFSSGFTLDCVQSSLSAADRLHHYRYVPIQCNARGSYVVQVDSRQSMALFGMRQIESIRTWSAEDMGRGRLVFCVHLEGRRGVCAPGYREVLLNGPRLGICWQRHGFTKEAYWKRGDREVLVSFDGNPQMIEALVQQQPDRYPSEFVDVACGRQPEFWWMDVPLMESLAAAARPLLELSITGAISSIYYRSKNFELVALALRNIQIAHSRDESAVKVSPRIRRIVERVREELDRDDAERKPIADLARQCGISTTALCTAFKSIHQVTVFGYLQRRRLERARQLLLNTDLAVKEIAWQVGYAHTSNFALAFKSHFGFTPRQTRRGVSGSPSKDELH